MIFISVQKETESFWKFVLAGQGMALHPNYISHLSGRLSKSGTTPILNLVEPKMRKLMSKLIYWEPTDPFSPAEVGVVGKHLTLIDLGLVRQETLLVRSEFIIGLTGNLITKAKRSDNRFEEMIQFDADSYVSCSDGGSSERSWILLNTPTAVVKQSLGDRTSLLFTPTDLICMSPSCTVDKYPTMKLWGMKRIRGPGEAYFSGCGDTSTSNSKQLFANGRGQVAPKLCVVAAFLGIMLAFILVVSDAILGVALMD